MTSSEGQYSGAALKAFVLGVASPALSKQILAEHGLDRIDEAHWYPLSTARSIYQMVRQKVGNQALHAVGLQMIDAASFPSGITDIKSLLMSLNDAYHMNVRGSDLGHVTFTFDDDHSASVIFASPLPCALSQGALQGCFRRCQKAALIEHGVGGCVDAGDLSCLYRITW